MPKAKSNPLMYVGIKGSVVAIGRRSGEIAWSQKLRKGSTFVPILEDGDRVYALSGGEVSCLDAHTGALLWHNALRGFGVGYALFSSPALAGIAAIRAAEDDAAAQSASVGAASAAAAAAISH